MDIGPANSSALLESRPKSAGSIQFSILSGRILLKDVHYHTSNQTVKIVKAQISWRYWIRGPMTEDELHGYKAEGEGTSTRNTSCRIKITINGLEWVLYNRTAAYDNILSQMPTSRNAPGEGAKERNVLRKSATNLSVATPSFLANSFKSHAPKFIQRMMAWVKQQLPNLDPKELLPLAIEVSKGAIICGNASTSSILVSEFQRAEGTFGITRSRSQFDVYKQLLNLRFTHAVIRMKENNNYHEPMTATGEALTNYIDRSTQQGSSNLAYNAFAKLWNRLKLYRLVTKYLAKDRKRPSSKRMEPEGTPIGADFSTLEYAIERKVLESPTLELLYYVDVAGEVPPFPHIKEHASSGIFDVGNGDMGPEWGVDLVVHGGTLRYGPWADRQRAELQRAFFPPTYQDATPTAKLQPGDQRLWTSLKVFIEFRGDVQLHIPFREASKNWQWDGLSESPNRPRTREPGYLHVTAGDRSSISYLMPMVAGSNGYEPILEVHLDTAAVTSSLNDIRLVSSESCRIHCDLPSPLRWNAERTWGIAISFRNPELFILRDHINMFTDLGKDWASGPPTHFNRFVPMVYEIDADLHHYELNLYANDQNIIDKPLMKDENAILTVFGNRLKSRTVIPSNVFRPDWTKISFSVDVPDVELRLSLPRWNVNALHAPKEGSSLAKVESFTIDGSYLYYAEVHEENVEQLKLNFDARNVAFKALGWSIRYLMIFRENYLGSFTHFSTLYEYLERKERGLPPGDPVLQKYRKGKTNMLNVDLGVVLQNGMVLLPAGLPGHEISSSAAAGSETSLGLGPCVVMSFPELQVYLRVHDHGMEMGLNIDTITSGIEHNLPERVSCFSTGSKSLLVIDGIDITANRLFGPPPSNLTYVCIWEIDVGHTKACFSASEGSILAAAGKAFRINFSDLLNSPASDYMPPTFPDLTFLAVKLRGCDVVWKAGNAALHLTLPSGLKLDHNDLGGHKYRTLTTVQLPHISVKMYLRELNDRVWLEAGNVTSDLFLDIYSRPADWQKAAEMQAMYVEEQDKETGRAASMFDILRQSTGLEGSITHSSGVYLPPPSLSHSSAYHPHVRRSSRPPNVKPEPSGTDGESDYDQALAYKKSLMSSSNTFKRPKVAYAHGNMSSGDESDDEDLTDRSDSDWFEDGFTERKSTCAVKSHRLLTRHFISENNLDPALWDDSGPFLCVKDSKLPPFSYLPASHVSSVASSPRAAPGHEPVTMYRLAQRRTLEANVTPLIFPVFSELEEDLAYSVPTPELVIDNATAYYISQVIDEQKSTDLKRTILDVQLESIVLRAVLQMDGLSDSKKPGFLEKFAILESSFRKLTLSGTISPNTFDLNVGIDLTKTHLSSLVCKERTVQLSSPALSVSLSEIAAKTSEFNISVECSTVFLQLTHAAPEMVLVAGLSLSDLFSRMKEVDQRRKESVASTVQRAVLAIIRRSGDDLLVDRLSTIQPSFLVQVGLPHQLRTNLVFRFLYHLRDCLWHLRERDDTVHDVAEFGSPSVELLESSLKKRLQSLDSDAANSSDLAILASLFIHDEAMEKEEAPSPPYFAKYISFKLAQLRVVASDESSDVPSELLLDNISSCVRIRTLDLLDAHQGNRFTAVSQTSLRRRESRAQRISIAFSFGVMRLTIHPHLMNIAQEILRVQRTHKRNEPKPSKVLRFKEGQKRPETLYLDVTCAFQDLLVQAVAESLIFEFGSTQLQTSSAVSMQTERIQAMNHSILLGSLFLRARSPYRGSKRSGQDELASLVVSDLSSSVVAQESPSGADRRIIIGVGGLRFSVPRSALHLYRFVEEWRADFLPGVESTMHALLAEFERSSDKPKSPTHVTKDQYKLLIKLESAGIYLRVMRNTWLSWELSGAVAHLESLALPQNTVSWSFGLHVSSQMFAISSRSPESHAETILKLKLPSLSSSGHHEDGGLRAIVLMQFLEFKVKPSHWDTLLGVQQKFGQDFNDLVALAQKSRAKRAAQRPVQVQRQESNHVYAIHFKMEGFRIGFEGVSSVLCLECPGIGGRLEEDSKGGTTWSVVVSDLALSLAPKGSWVPRTAAFSSLHRTAFVVIDFRVAGSSRKEDNNSVIKELKLTITKAHAVMQPSSIGEFGDFVDQLQVCTLGLPEPETDQSSQMEMLERREERSHELDAFKEKAQQILKTFEVAPPRDQQPEMERTLTSWLNQYVVEFSIRSVGVAFPLAHIYDGEKEREVKAFLFSIKSINFGTHRGETGQAIMKSLSFQFISRQSDPHSFSSEKHLSHNQLLYPEMKAHIHSSGSSFARQFFIRAVVSGFVLDVDSTMPDYIFSLFDVYREGKDRVAKLSANLPRPSLEDSVEEKKPVDLPTSNFFASLDFLSGKVRMYSSAAATSARSGSFSGSWEDPRMLGLGAEVFNLPVVSVWGEYRAASIGKAYREGEPSILMFKSTVHSSHNVLRPTLLPFLTELIELIENRLRSAYPESAIVASTDSLQIHETGDTSEHSQVPSLSPSLLQVSFSLRIDQSRLELSCHPDVNVVAGLTWDSGGFVVNASPGARQVTFTGTVGGLSIGLKHGFLSEDCVSLNARNLNFSVAFSRPNVEDGYSVSSVSFVLDTEFHGGVRFSRLQDMLCFKAVWLDRIPVFYGHQDDTDDDQSPVTLNQNAQTDPAPAARQEFTTVILVRIRQIKLDVDLGQSISTVSLHLTDAVLRTKITQISNEVSFSVADVKVLGRGNVAGRADVSNFIFQTVRRTNRSISTEDDRSRMLELRMTSGPLVIVIDSEYQRLLHYRAEPLEIEILDDWSMTVPLKQLSQPLQLSVTVASPEVVAVATVSAIPKLMTYVNRFKANLETQRAGASRESKTFRISQSPKPDNPLSAVAEAMIHSARTRLKEADNTLSYVIKQDMSLRLDLLRLIVFPRNMRDSEVAQFVGRDARAHLSRLVESKDAVAKRDIHLSFTHMKISRVTQLGNVATPPGNEFYDGKQWVEDLMKNALAADIVGLPSIKMHMKSEENLDEVKRQLEYDFDSQFIRGQGVREDENIYITLNVSLYSWLTVLRKTLTREMDQVTAAAEWRPIPSTAPVRKPDPAGTTGPSKAFTLPSDMEAMSSVSPAPETNKPSSGDTIFYKPGKRNIERLTMRQLGDATPDVMHPFFMKKAGFSLEDSLPQYVHEYATTPLEKIHEVLLKLYSKQLLVRNDTHS
ncbi:Macrophage colony-stimulating factor 1 receptor [Marasmius sp. AFHP31]|nr:Macrophage colony-stimulating factor 1 receptor [Marasmius sp. AFHP31]